MAYGNKFGKVNDMERCGLFGEMGYMVGKGYTPPIWGATNVRDKKKSQMFPSYRKTKTGLQDCYFDKQFKRLFIGEVYETAYDRQRKEEIEAKKKNLSRAFIPSSYPKKQSCPGAYDACFGGTVPAFPPLLKDVKKSQAKLTPIYPPSPPKKGGCGYANIGFHPYPKASLENYDDAFVSAQDARRQGERTLGLLAGGYPGYFDKNPYFTKEVKPTYKRVFDKRTTLHGAFYGPRKAREKGDAYYGGLSKFPEFMPSENKRPKTKKGEKLSAFYPQPRDRTFYTNSVVNRKIDIAVNKSNYNTIQPITFTNDYI